MTCRSNDVGVQSLGKGVGGIDKETHVMLATECHHLRHVHRAADGHAVVERNILFARLRAVVERLTGLLQHLHGLAALCRASEYENQG